MKGDAVKVTQNRDCPFQMYELQWIQSFKDQFKRAKEEWCDEKGTFARMFLFIIIQVNLQLSDDFEYGHTWSMPNSRVARKEPREDSDKWSMLEVIRWVDDHHVLVKWAPTTRTWPDSLVDLRYNKELARTLDNNCCNSGMKAKIGFTAAQPRQHRTNNGFIEHYVLQDANLNKEDLKPIFKKPYTKYQAFRNAGETKCPCFQPVHRWTHKTDIFTMDLVLMIPIHIEAHWCMALGKINSRKGIHITVATLSKRCFRLAEGVRDEALREMGEGLQRKVNRQIQKCGRVVVSLRSAGNFLGLSNTQMLSQRGQDGPNDNSAFLRWLRKFLKCHLRLGQSGTVSTEI
uniref:Ubiquitin-like protease family profile domain-containing protein n=1 Tax=Branchiostoma floridae TaxID=7739 RepID=C3ZB05_BRAFL|eukprot:XP_002594031.1 hypothetical protein BRAFLDRAFT_68529 [Branchiostoma floridae]